MYEDVGGRERTAMALKEMDSTEEPTAGVMLIQIVLSGARISRYGPWSWRMAETAPDHETH